MKKNILKSVWIISIMFIVGLFINSCEDAAPTDYVQEKFVEAFLMVNEPIDNIIVMNSQPVQNKFDYEKAIIRDAEVTITGDGKIFNLVINAVGDSGYYNPDRTYLVKPNTKYDLNIKLKDGKVISGSTITPSDINWTDTVGYEIQYPKDSLKLPDRYYISWSPVKEAKFYLISVIPLDTLNYGKYLNPATDELNRRVYNSFANDSEEYYYERSTYPLIANTQTSVVWAAFKWFGKHQVNVMVPDNNFLMWYLQNTQQGQMNKLLSSVDGAYGVFGSASIARREMFLLKNQK